ncbi:flagellar assembly protein FliH [Babesia caballi]|uniref:Flagellar assembly protein FliH n=1 Tax=Babesia caballi TaxID=5871 RepID=A0AAV4LSL7_BABCB|nr:flagellar assembly protein FliH [Babesia caballi]
MRRHVGGCDARASDFPSGISTASFIPDELLKSPGQLGNETITRTSVQSLNYLPDLCTKIGIRLSNFFEKFLNFLGEGIGTIPTTAPILARHPQDPVNGLLQVGRAVKRKVDRGG